MKVAVVNAGSSSLKIKLYKIPEAELLYAKTIENIGENGAKFKTHEEALNSLDVDLSEIDAIGHRVVHGGEKFSSPVVVNEDVLKEIQKLVNLAPLHNPANIIAIKIMQNRLKGIPQVAVFDTAFHATMPKEAFMYGLPKEMYDKHGIRRYGFHGSSHSYITKEAARLLNKDVQEINIISLHLGNGASACAIKNGKSIDTSMGFTPLEGLLMGSRSGDIDPAIVLFMQRELGMSLNEVDKCLNKESGLLGICHENDVRKILASNDEDAILALNMMTRRIAKYIGSYMALLGSVDAVVFTGGIGENSSYIREKVMESKMFENINVLVIKTDEELEIANQTMEVLGSSI